MHSSLFFPNSPKDVLIAKFKSFPQIVKYIRQYTSSILEIFPRHPALEAVYPLPSLCWLLSHPTRTQLSSQAFSLPWPMLEPSSESNGFLFFNWLLPFNKTHLLWLPGMRCTWMVNFTRPYMINLVLE